MAYEGHIIVPSGLTPVHMFDLWGPLYDAKKLGAIEIESFRANAMGHLSDEEIARRVQNYKLLMAGDDWATVKENKRSIIRELGEYSHSSEIDFSQFLQKDGLAVMRAILDADEGIGIITSFVEGNLKDNFPEDIASRMGNIYGVKKSPEMFRGVYGREREEGNQMVSHTADELSELKSAVASGLDLMLVYVNRNDSKTRERVTEAGVYYFVNDLTTAPYEKFVSK